MARPSLLMPERLDRIVHYIGDYQKKKGFSPSIREIGSFIGIESTSHVKHYLAALKKQGRLSYIEHVPRSIQLTARGDLPVLVRWWGYIAGGQPIPIPNQADFSPYHDQFVSVLMSMLGPTEPEKLFALTVQGDSMLDANISDGDTVIFKPAVDANNGEMVAIWLEDENSTTLKYFHRDSNGIVLKPANPAYQPIRVDRPEQVRVQGKVVAVIRKMEHL